MATSSKPVVKKSSKKPLKKSTSRKEAVLKRDKTKAKEIIASTPVWSERKQPGHMDYRLVLNDVWSHALKTSAEKALVLRHREAFEALGTVQGIQCDYKTPALVMRESPQPALIRTLGLWETEYHNKYGKLIAHDGEGALWIEVWRVARSWCSFEYDHRLLGRLMYDALVALALNAGFEEKDLA